MFQLRQFPLALILAALVFGCSGSDKGQDNNDDDKQKDLQQIESILAVQDSLGNALDDMLAALDTAAVKDSLVALFEADSVNVLKATANSQGVAVDYKNGMRGGVLLDPLDIGGPEPALSAPTKQTDWHAAAGLVNHRPASKKTIFLNPSYHERQVFADPLIAQGNAGFAKTGYSNFEVYVNDQCTIERFASLSGYGVVHFYSHGYAWPDENNIDEVYLMTGELASPATTAKYFANVKAGKIPIVMYGSANRYFISPSFVAHSNSFHDDTTFVYLGFCFGWLGNWQDTLIQVAGAGACVGFDWAVYTRWNSMWARHIYNDLCDTSKTEPMKLGDWRSAPPAIDNTYWSPSDHRWVSIWTQGHSDLVMWNALRITLIDPPEAIVGSTVMVRGVGFGNEQSTSLVKFDDIIAATNSWSDSLITAIVPNGFTSGNVVVTVGGQNTNAYPFRTASIRLVLDQDSVFRYINDTVYVHAQVSGTLDSTVFWRVLPYGETISPGFVSQIRNNYVRVIGGSWFAGLCRVECVARADTTARDTVAVAYSAMQKLKAGVYFLLRFDAAMNHSISCAQITYDPTTSFVVHNWSGDETSPKPVWTGDIASIRGSWEYGDWPYYDSLYVRAEFSPLGDSLRRLELINYRHGRDLNYRQWEHRIDVSNIPLDYYVWTENVRIIGYQIDGQAVQSRVNSFWEYYLENDMQENCAYERTATTANWNSSSVTPRFELKLSPNRF